MEKNLYPKNLLLCAVLICTFFSLAFDCGNTCPDTPICTGDQCTDCAFIAEHTSNRVTVEMCQLCQFTPCDNNSENIVENEKCYEFYSQCKNGKIVIEACACDESCTGDTPLCGRWASIHDICTSEDPL